MSFLDHMKKHLGLHATIFMAYADPEDSIKISECVFWLYTYANSNMVFRFESEGFKETHGFSTQNAQVVKAFRDSWGLWAKNTCRCIWHIIMSHTEWLLKWLERNQMLMGMRTMKKHNLLLRTLLPRSSIYNWMVRAGGS
jgi:hypothetical protein